MQDIEEIYVGNNVDLQLLYQGFNNCPKLHKMTLGTGTKNLNVRLFINTPNLTEINYLGTIK